MGAFTSDRVKNYSPKCWLPLSHIEALLNIDDITLVGCCDHDKHKVSMVAKKYNYRKMHYNHMSLLDSHDIQLLSIATRTKGRSVIIENALNKGIKALHIEKPLCNDLSEINFVEQAVKKAKADLTYGTLRRYFPIYEKAKELVDSGLFGTIQEIQISFGHDKLFWTHPHSVDLILFFAGNRVLESVQASLSDFEVEYINGKPEVDLDPKIDHAIMKFSDGLTGIITKSIGMNVTVSCSNGKVTVHGDGHRITTETINENNPYPSLGQNIFDAESSIQGTACAISKLVTKLQSRNESVDRENERLGGHIFLGHRLLFLMVQSHMTNGAQIKLSDAWPELKINGRTGELFA